MNDENIRPYGFDQRSAEEARESGRKGGVASGESRRKAKTLAEAMKRVAFLDLTEKERIEELKRMGVSDDDMTIAVASAMAVVKKAMSGDVSAFNAIRDIIGEKPTDRTQADMDVHMKIEYIDSNQELAHSEEEVE